MGQDERGQQQRTRGGRPPLHRITEPLPTDPVQPVLVGLVAWAVALVVLLLVRDSLAPEDRWWVWTAVAGVASGLLALAWAVRRRRRRQLSGDPVAASSREVGSGSSGRGSVSRS